MDFMDNISNEHHHDDDNNNLDNSHTPIIVDDDDDLDNNNNNNSHQNIPIQPLLSKKEKIIKSLVMDTIQKIQDESGKKITKVLSQLIDNESSVKKEEEYDAQYNDFHMVIINCHYIQKQYVIS